MQSYYPDTGLTITIDPALRLSSRELTEQCLMVLIIVTVKNGFYDSMKEMAVVVVSDFKVTSYQRQKEATRGRRKLPPINLSAGL